MTLGCWNKEVQKWVSKSNNKDSSSIEVMLEDIVDTKFVNAISEKFTKVTEVRCFITNPAIYLLSDITNITKFCGLVRSSHEGRRRCSESCRTISLDAKCKGKAIFSTCHAGLIYAVAPIMVNNQHVGSFFCGQVGLLGTKLIFDDIKQNVSDLNLDETLLRNYLDEIEIVSRERLITALEMLTLMTNYIAEMGVANIAQQQLMAEMKAKNDLESLLKETEYKALQEQINPHFLFNCLNTIAQVAMIEGACQTQDLIYAISDILRSLIKHPEQTITVREELKYVKDYLAIQLARFGDRIHVAYNIDEKVLDAKLPKFALQTLVENAIVHGLEPKIEGGNLTINCQKDAKNITLKVIDTGVGIQEVKMRNLFKAKSNAADHTENIMCLGINNVQQRIKYYYGQGYGLKIDSKEGEGCQAIVTLPFIKN